MKMFFLTPSGALALPANRSDSEFAGAGLARILLMLALLLSNWKAYAAIGVSSIAPTSAAEIKISSCGVDVTGTAKDYYNNTLPWGVAGTLNTAIDVATGIGHMPAAIGHLGEGTGRFSADPSWGNAPGVLSDALVVGSVLSATASALPSLNGSAAAAAASPAPKSVTIVAQDGTKITGFTKHGINRAVGDGAKRAGVKPDALLDALKNPRKVTTGIDVQGRPYSVFTGKDARVVVNPQTGQVVSVNPLSRIGAN